MDQSAEAAGPFNALLLGSVIPGFSSDQRNAAVDKSSSARGLRRRAQRISGRFCWPHVRTGSVLMSTSHASEPSDQLIEMAFTDSEADLAPAQPEQPSAAQVIEPAAAAEIFPQQQSLFEEDPVLAFIT